MKRFKFRNFLACSILLFVLASPIAKAVIPLVFGLGIVTGIETGVGTGVVVSAAVHVAAAALLFWNFSGSENTAPPAKAPAISVRLNDAALPAPAGWTKSTDPSDPNPVPPSSVSPVSGKVSYSFDSVIGCNSPPRLKITSESLSEIAGAILSAANSTCKFSYGNNVYSIKSIDAATGSMIFDCIEPRGMQCSFRASASVVAPNSCPSGTNKDSSGNCIVVDPKSVPLPADNTCQILKVGNTFQNNPRDPDCTNQFDPSFLSTDKSVLTLTGKGGKEQSVIKANADGSTTVTTTRDNGDGTNTSNTINISPKPGSGGDNTPTVTGVSTSTGNADSGGDDGSGGDEGPGIEIPTDYNRETTQQSILNETKANGAELKKITEGFDSNSISKTNADADALEDAQNGLTDTINSYLPSSWQELSEKGIFFVLPDSLSQLFTAQCAPWVFNVPFAKDKQPLDLSKFQDMIKSIGGFFVWVWTFIQLVRIFNPKPDN